MYSSASLVRALWQSSMDLLLCILLERAAVVQNADKLSLQKVICWLLKVISSSAACLMAAVSAWKTAQWSFILKECSVMVSVRVSDITNPPPVPFSVLDPSVKQQMPWVLASMMSEFNLFLLYCVFVCKFSESFMAVIDGFVVVYFIGESSCSADKLSLQKVICWFLKVISSSAACLMAAVSAWKTAQ